MWTWSTNALPNATTKIPSNADRSIIVPTRTSAIWVKRISSTATVLARPMPISCVTTIQVVLTNGLTRTNSLKIINTFKENTSLILRTSIRSKFYWTQRLCLKRQPWMHAAQNVSQRMVLLAKALSTAPKPRRVCWIVGIGK